MSFIGQTSPSGNNVLIADNGVFATILHVKTGLYFYVSSIDVDYIIQYTWNIDTRPDHRFGYVSRTYKGHTIFLHRFIMQQYCDNISDKNLEIDHIDRNPSNNIRDNLRLVTRRINVVNRGVCYNSQTGLIGVNKSSTSPTFETKIKFNGKYKALGHYNDKYDAALVRDKFIFLNFPESEYIITNLYNNRIPQEVLEKYNIDPNDPSTIPFIPSNKLGNNKYEGVSKEIYGWKAYIINKGEMIYIGFYKTELEAVIAREQYLIDNYGNYSSNNHSNILWADESTGLINIAGIILTRDEMEEKTRGY